MWYVLKAENKDKTCPVLVENALIFSGQVKADLSDTVSRATLDYGYLGNAVFFIVSEKCNS